MTTATQIGQWFDDGVRQDAAFMLVVTDTFDWSNYPVYVPRGKDVRDSVAEYHRRNMQRVMEVYDLAGDRDEQLGRVRTGREYIPQ